MKDDRKDEKQTLDLLVKEAERRRHEATEKSRQPLPSAIRSINYTQVLYTLHPKMLPFGQLDSNHLRQELEKKFHLKIKLNQMNLPDFNEMKKLGLSIDQVTDEALINIALSGDDPSLEFIDGRYPTGPNTFVLIERLVFTRENILARVCGVTEIAQIAIADAFDVFCESCGAVKKWSSEEVQSHLQMVSFETSSQVDLGVKSQALVSSELRKYLDGNLVSGDNIASKMNSYSAYDDFKPSGEITSIWTFDELNLQIHTFNIVTGRAEVSEVNFDTRTKDERGRGILSVTSSLSFDEHKKMIQNIVESISSGEKAR